MDDNRRRLFFFGFLLFLLGLFTGFLLPLYANVRMGLSAHLEGVMNGIFLIGVGAAWSEIRLSDGQKRLTFWVAIYGTYANWIFTSLGAAFGTAALSPIAAAGRVAPQWQENLITAGFLSVGITMVLTVILALWGLRRRVFAE